MFNKKGVLCIAAYHKLSNVWGKVVGNASKDAFIEHEGYMFNDKAVLCSAAHSKLAKKGGATMAKISRATAMDENHSHICTSALCQSGASIRWERGKARMQHHCYHPERSGLEGQKPQQVQGLWLHVCKKCHRTAKKCTEASCVAPACSNNSLTLCKHLH